MDSNDDIIRHPDSYKRPTINDEVSRRRFLSGLGGLVAAGAGVGSIEALGIKKDMLNQSCPTPASDVGALIPKIVPESEHCKKSHHHYGVDTSPEAQAHAIQTMLETENGKNLSHENREGIRRAAGFGPLQR